MGTYYRVTYADANGTDYQPAVEALLKAINDEVSTYIETATISRFNQAAEELPLSGKETYFLTNYRAARKFYELTDGAFDPTVMPLVNYWGFGYTEKKPITAVDSVAVDSLMNFVGMDKVALVEEGQGLVLRKELPGVQLDFSALAKGYAVDAVGALLAGKGVRDYLVDIGGEVRGAGRNRQGKPWRIGINVPQETSSPLDFQATLPLDNRAVATSGNYRNFYEVDGVKYSHTINPYTGFPERNTLLSASVLAADCMSADALATACMVLGTEKALALIESLADTEAYFIFSMPDGNMLVRATSGLEGHNQE